MADPHWLWTLAIAYAAALGLLIACRTTDVSPRTSCGAEMAALSGPPDPPPGRLWAPAPELSDEFDGPQLDDAKWMPRHPFWAGRPPSRFDPDNVSVQDGLLRLRSTTDLTDLTEIEDPSKDIWVRAACVTSIEPVATYGYYETRMKASRLSMTSAFWMQGKYSEIDVVEQLGAPVNHPEKQFLMLMNTHYFPTGWDNDTATPREWRMPRGAADTFHVYGVWWMDKNTARFYHDGEFVAEIQFGGEFLEPMYLHFDTEVFVWEGLPDIDSLKDDSRNTMLVDWVRVWRLVKQ